MKGRHVLLIAKYSARYSVRGGMGLVFVLLSLTFGLLVAHSILQPVEMAAQELARSNDPAGRQEATEKVLDAITGHAKPVVTWMLTPSGHPDAAAKKGAEQWATFLLDDRPALLSAIFLILLFGWPLVVAFGAFDLYSGDIGSRQLRYQLLRADRGSIYVGRLLGLLVTFVLVLLLLGLTVTGYMGAKLSVYGWPALLSWGLHGALALIIVSLPYVALCAWVSTWFGSSFASLTLASLIIGGVPLFATIGSQKFDGFGYVSYLLPWGYQTQLFHRDPANIALAVIGCLLQAALFGWLGYRNFMKRDL